MPNCVVKMCKNNYFDCGNKADGVTYHKFPKENYKGRDDWIRMIRQSRGEESWEPLASSVVCSDHFEKDKMYTTKMGQRRLYSAAVPVLAKYVSENSWAPIRPGFKRPHKTTVTAEKSSSTTAAETEIKAERLSPEPATSDSILENRNAENLHATITFENPNVQTTTSSLPKMDLQVEVKMEEDSDVLSSPPSSPDVPAITISSDEEASKYTKQDLQRKVIKLRGIYLEHTKKIKMLNQKIRRLEGRNKSLKKTLISFKKEHGIDADTIKKLNENQAAADFFTVYNRKKKNKQIEYSQSIRKFCLELDGCSPKAYRYVRETFDYCLPNTTTLLRWGRVATSRKKRARKPSRETESPITTYAANIKVLTNSSG